MKPLVVLFIPPLSLEEFNNIEIKSASLKDDYNFLIIESAKPDVKVFYEKDLEILNIDQLKKLIDIIE